MILHWQWFCINNKQHWIRVLSINLQTNSAVCSNIAIWILLDQAWCPWQTNTYDAHTHTQHLWQMALMLADKNICTAHTHHYCLTQQCRGHDANADQYTTIVAIDPSLILIDQQPADQIESITFWNERQIYYFDGDIKLRSPENCSDHWFVDKL